MSALHAPPHERAAHLARLRDVLRAQGDRVAAAQAWPLRRQLFDAALQWDDLPLVMPLGAAMQRAGEATPDDEVAMAEALWRFGRHHEALALCRRLSLAHPHCEPAALLYEQLRDPPRHTPADGELRLEPLGPQHLRDFAWQYWDPGIAQDACLPEFESDAHWLAWLDEQHALGDQVLFAVLHDAWGFVGTVSLSMHGGTGFFSYWIGKDFRGMGLGPLAGRILLRLAREAWGLQACYAKVFTANTASRRGLAKIGFGPQPVPISGAGADELLYRWPAPLVRAAAAAQEARALFDALADSTRILYPVLVSQGETSPCPHA